MKSFLALGICIVTLTLLIVSGCTKSSEGIEGQLQAVCSAFKSHVNAGGEDSGTTLQITQIREEISSKVSDPSVIKLFEDAASNLSSSSVEKFNEGASQLLGKTWNCEHLN